MRTDSTPVRVGIAVAFCSVFAVVLYQTGIGRPNLAANMTGGSESSATCDPQTAWSFGSCTSDCVEVPQNYPDCPGGFRSLAECNAAYQDMCPSSAAACDSNSPCDCVNCVEQCAPGQCDASSAAACPSGTFYSHGSCTSDCVVVPQNYPDCPGGYTSLEQCNTDYKAGC